MAAPKDKQFLFDWPQDTEASPDKEDVASVELNREAESRLRAATAELAEAPTDPELLLNTALAALLEEQPELSLRYQHRFQSDMRQWWPRTSCCGPSRWRNKAAGRKPLKS